MKIIVISSDYPGPDLIYGDVFVQARIRIYKLHHEVIVLGYDPRLIQNREFLLEGVSVQVFKELKDFYERIIDYEADVIAVHLVHHSYIPFLIKLVKPLVVFVHGFEVLSWTRRLMNYTTLGDFRYLLPYLISNQIQLAGMRKLVKCLNERMDMRFVFVSSWLKSAAETDLKMKIRNYQIIPNGIDLTLFPYVRKSNDQRKKILVIRSFRARNYANDLVVDAIVSLSKKDFFGELEFTIYGEGYLFPLLTERIKHIPSVKLKNRFVQNQDIPAIHREHGIFLCPSRLDTQGVSMCESMASGLVPITSPIGGIPEYTEDGIDSFHAKDAEEIANRIEYLFFNPEKFSEMSQNARLSVERTCNLRKTVEREIELLKSVIN